MGTRVPCPQYQHSFFWTAQAIGATVYISLNWDAPEKFQSAPRDCSRGDGLGSIRAPAAVAFQSAPRDCSRGDFSHRNCGGRKLLVSHFREGGESFYSRRVLSCQ